MNHEILLNLVADLGYSLAMCGAETFRVEDSVNRILAAYEIESDVFAIPNSLIVTIHTADGKSATRMRRIGHHGNDLDSVEKYNSLSRRICTKKPQPEIAVQWLKEVEATRVHYKPPILLFGNILVAAGFSVFFGGTVIDALCAGVCGLLMGFADQFLEKFRTNGFFKTIVCAFIMTFFACIFGVTGIADNTDMVIIGVLMLLVPGLLFTNAMRDIIFGDTNSGINRVVEVLLVAAAIALGTGAAWNASAALWGVPQNAPALLYPYWIQCFTSIISCVGFAYLFNIQGYGKLLCALGGALAWAAYGLTDYFGGGELLCYFFSTLTAAAYAEIMARIRKYPAISYLVISILPLIPGAGIYYTTNRLVSGDMAGFANQGKHVIAIAGVIAVGILMISTIVRLWNEWKRHTALKQFK